MKSRPSRREDAKPRGLGVAGAFSNPEKQEDKAKIEGGYRLIPVRDIAALWFCFKQGQLLVLDLRVYLACHEALARRCTLPKGKNPTFTVAEIQRLTGGSTKRLKASIQRLEALGFLKFSESEIRFARGPAGISLDQTAFSSFLKLFPNNSRLLPVPRRILRLLCGGARTSLIATILGHLLWGLYRAMPRGGNPGGFSSTGRVKCSWIADTFGVDLRRVKQARRELIDLGWLIPEESKQWQLNRYGARFQINLTWRRENRGRGEVPATPAGTELPPPPAQIDPGLPPPESNKNPPNGEHKNQEPDSQPQEAFPQAAVQETGVCISKSKETKTQEPKPTLKHVVLEDLKNTARLLELHAQAVDLRLISASESDRLQFVAAAEHALVIGTENPCGLFIRLVRAKLWHYLTQDDEDTANRRLKSFLHTGPTGFARGAFSKPAPAKQPELSQDARFVRDITRVLGGRGIAQSSIWRLVNHERPEWTKERWDKASLELGRGI